MAEDLDYRMRQLRGTTAEWAAHDLVIGDGEIALELLGDGSYRMKIGTAASHRFSQLPYILQSPSSPEALQTSAWAPTRDIVYTRFFPTQRPPDLYVIGEPAKAQVNAANQLEVDADWTSTTNRVFYLHKFAEGVFRVKLLRNKFMLRFSAPDWSGRALWSSDGASISFGIISPTNTITTVIASGTLKGSATTDVIWLELVVGPTAQGAGVLLRSWVDGTARPAAPDVTVTMSAAVAGNEHNEGVLTLSSFTGTLATFLEFQFYDGASLGAQAAGQAAFVGRWFPRFDSGKVCMGTVCAGSKFRFRTQGAATVTVRYCGTLGVSAGLYPVGDIYLNGSPVATFTFDGGVGWQGRTLLGGLDASKTNYVEVRLRGIEQTGNKWLLGAGLLIESLDTPDAAGIITPWPDVRPKMLFIGDSITEGALGRGTPSTPMNCCGDVSWPVLSAESLGCQAVVNGFGGTGLTVSGSGGMPAANVNAFFYMKDRPIDTAAENVKFIVINHGTNDNGQGVSTATFQAAYIAFLQALLAAHTSVQCIYAMRVFSGLYAAQVQAAVAAINDPRVSYVDTSSWTDITYTDGATHPDVNGHAKAAAHLVTAVGVMQPASWL